MKERKKITGGNFLALGLYAFLGLGMEVVLLMLEQDVYKVNITEWDTSKHILHWIFTCVIWGVFTVALALWAKHRCQFSIMGERRRAPAVNWIIAILLVAVCVGLNAWSRGTLKLIGEFTGKELSRFIFQYIYYVFEVFLIFSVVAYGQKAGEMWFGSSKVPWGGILAGLTWGLVHSLTKGSILVGLEALVAGVLYGCIYLLIKKRAVYAYPLLLLAFAL